MRSPGIYSKAALNARYHRPRPVGQRERDGCHGRQLDEVVPSHAVDLPWENEAVTGQGPGGGVTERNRMLQRTYRSSSLELDDHPDETKTHGVAGGTSALCVTLVIESLTDSLALVTW
jgi:hypothetical protein